MEDGSGKVPMKATVLSGEDIAPCLLIRILC
jgi:hypothetical protein